MGSTEEFAPRLHVPETVGAEGMIEALGPLLSAHPGLRVAIPRAESGGRAVEEWLRARGAQVDAFPLYRTLPNLPEAPGVEDGLQRLRTGAVDVVTFASGSAARALLALGGPEVPRWCAQVQVACMGAPSTKTAEELGIRVDVRADGDFARLVAALQAQGRRGT